MFVSLFYWLIKRLPNKKAWTKLTKQFKHGLICILLHAEECTTNFPKKTKFMFILYTFLYRFKATKSLRLCRAFWQLVEMSVAGFMWHVCRNAERFRREASVAVATRHPSERHTRLPIKENNNDCDSHFHSVMKTPKKILCSNLP